MADHRLDPAFVRAQIETLRVAYPDIAADEEQWLLTLESETGLHEFLTKIAVRKKETDQMIEDLGDLIADYKSRCDRFEQRSEGLRGLAFKLMQQVGIRKLELAVATLSIRVGQQKVIVTDEAALPPDCIRTRTEPDKVRIKDRLVRGETVNGAELSNREESLTMRIK